MKSLSYTQEYFLCAVNSKGNIASSNGGIPLVVSSILELLNHRYITLDEKGRVIADKMWDDKLSYLKPLYETITSMKKPRPINEIALDYDGKKFNALFSAIGASLVEAGCADEAIKQGLTKEKIKYIPKMEAVKKVVEKIRFEFLEDGTMTDETICLAALLDNDGLMRNYFSKFERDDLKKRLKEVRNSEAHATVKNILEEMAAVLTVIISTAT